MIEHKQNTIPYREVTPAAGMFVTPLLLIGYLVAKPFYLFPSGGAQVGDVIIVALFVLAFLGRQAITRVTGPFLWACVLFSTYTLIVNGIWALLQNDLSMLMTPIYYFFNTTIVYIILNGYGRIGDQLLKVMLAGAIVSIGIQAALSFLIMDSGTQRQALFFNNVNQLGYWSLLSATIFCVLARHLNLRLLIQLPVLVVAIYLIGLSLSKGAIIAALMLLAIHFSRNIGQFLLVAVIGVIAAFFVSETSLVEQVIDRLMNIGEQSDDDLSGRGYNRIWLYPQYLLFGAGELGLERFPETGMMEQHSTLGTVLFSYGVIGSFLFCLIFWQLVMLAGWRELLYLAPAFAYGLAHQGLRFSVFWVLFATIAIVGASLVSRSPETSRNDGRRRATPGLSHPEISINRDEPTPHRRPGRNAPGGPLDPIK
ncbi:MAG: hypothetical protein KAR37_16515 [Alphaproteobacteria bacterium]|nr:hypothetical protein [Alphaproteobacteria bacterium]